MSSACESSCSWTDYLVETINRITYNLVNLLTTIFGLTFNPADIIGDELLQNLSEFFYEFIALLSFADFQIQLLKVFLFTFISTVALIFVAWHIYGSKISEQFMQTNSTSKECDSSSEE